MISRGVRPRISFGLYRQGGRDARFRQVFPFRKSWPAIVALLVFDLAFLFPAVTTFLQAVELWGKADDLFNLVAALFITFWLLGWSIAPLLFTSLLALLVFGREEVRAGPGSVELFLGLPFIGLSYRYPAPLIRNIRLEYPPKKSTKSWRGSHVAFDYGTNGAVFGSDISELDVGVLKGRIEAATGTAMRNGDADTAADSVDWGLEPLRAAVTALKGSEKLPAAESEESGVAVTLSSTSTLVLIFANIVPLAGTAFWGWDLATVLLLYWAESAVTGFFNLCKIAVIGRWMALLAGPFFVGHFGAFMAVHFLFLYTLFFQKPFGDPSAIGNLDAVWLLFVTLWPALVALFISHAYSFFRNFIGRQEFRVRTIQTQMSEPYGRIVFMHVVLIFGGGLTLLLGDVTPVLLLVIVAKIVIDVKAHLKQRVPRDA